MIENVQSITADNQTTTTTGRYLTADEVADYLNLPVVTVYKYARNGDLPASKLGKHWRFSTRHIDEWIHQNRNVAEAAGTRRVLIVDTGSQENETLLGWLRHTGCEASLIRGSDGAIEVLQRENTDLILVEPEAIDRNVEVLKRIRRLAPDAIVAIMSEEFDAAFMDQALTTGPLTVLAKPLQRESVMNLLH